MTTDPDADRAQKLDGEALSSGDGRWPLVNRLVRAGLLRIQIHDKNSATVWYKRPTANG